jgi:hypothetical protein
MPEQSWWPKGKDRLGVHRVACAPGTSPTLSLGHVSRQKGARQLILQSYASLGHEYNAYRRKCNNQKYVEEKRHEKHILDKARILDNKLFAKYQQRAFADLSDIDWAYYVAQHRRRHEIALRMIANMRKKLQYRVVCRVHKKLCQLLARAIAPVASYVEERVGCDIWQWQRNAWPGQTPMPVLGVRARGQIWCGTEDGLGASGYQLHGTGWRVNGSAGTGAPAQVVIIDIED